MKAGYERIYASVNLDIIRDNVKSIMSKTPEGMKSIAVVKADAYGHGAKHVAESLKDIVWGFAVATPDEALYLRKHGIKNPILLLGFSPENRFEDLIEAEVRIPVFELEMAKVLSETAEKLGKKAYVHLKLDTGMSRIGLIPSEETLPLAKEILSLPGLFSEGAFTHLATADHEDMSHALSQVEKFRIFVDALKKEGFVLPICHVSNSASAIRMKGAGFDLCRLGISMYGLSPSLDVDFSEAPVSPAMSLYSEVIYVKTVKAGTPVGYGETYVCEKDTRIATVSAGYADGYARGLSNVGCVLIHGKKAKILGRICMDQMMVDVTDIEDVKVQDLVTLVGKDGDEELKFDELGALSGRFNYEFVCGISKRVPREYILNGKVIAEEDFF